MDTVDMAVDLDSALGIRSSSTGMVMAALTVKASSADSLAKSLNT